MNLDIVRAYSSLSSIRPLHRHDQHTKIRLVCSFAHFNVRSMLNEIETSTRARKRERERCTYISKRKGEEEEKNEIRTHTHTYIREQTGMQREKRTLLLQRMSLVRSTEVYKVNREEEEKNERKERDVMKIFNRSAFAFM